MELDTVAKIRSAFWRLVASESEDPSLTRREEVEDEVLYLYLTRGIRDAQRWMIKKGYHGWQKRSSALSFTGTDETTGGRYASVPTDFLRAYVTKDMSGIEEANGKPWGSYIETYDNYLEGDYFYFRGHELWLARKATPPATVYLRYHYLHPSLSSSFVDANLVFPLEARALIPATAAFLAMDEHWLPGSDDMTERITDALFKSRRTAEDVARVTKQPPNVRRKARQFTRY